MDVEATRTIVNAVTGWPAARRRAVNLTLLKERPLFDIEAVSACNIVCSFCPRDEMTRPSRVMSESTFAQVCDLLPDDAVVMFSGLGESILHPSLPSFVRRLAARRISACVITNGIRLTPERQRNLIDAGLEQFQISVHGLTDRELLPIVTRGSAAGVARANVEHLVATRTADLRVRVNFVETPENEQCRAAVQSWAESLGLEFYYRRLHSRGGSLGAPARDAGCTGCGIFGAVTFVTVEGRILPCVNDVRGAHTLGQVGETTWEALCDRKREVVAEDAWPSICGSCDDDYRWVILGQGRVDAG